MSTHSQIFSDTNLSVYLSTLGTKDNIKLNCGIIVSPYHTIGKPTSIDIIVLT